MYILDGIYKKNKQSLSDKLDVCGESIPISVFKKKMSVSPANNLSDRPHFNDLTILGIHLFVCCFVFFSLFFWCIPG